MQKRLMPTAIALIGLFLLGAVPLQAKNRGRARGHQHARAVAVVRETHPVQVRTFINLDEGRRRQRDRRRDVVIFPGIVVDGRDGRPPGWDRGRKVGWGNCDVPPGLAKKFGCRDRIFNRRVIVTRRDPRVRPVIIQIPFVGFVRLR
ncbi:MAG: hypothetical protein L0338_22660 [Acidobacteria bacterium]|nr:hypothetical protein [Acidobacteriota bacterium]